MQLIEFTVNYCYHCRSPVTGTRTVHNRTVKHAHATSPTGHLVLSLGVDGCPSLWRVLWEPFGWASPFGAPILVGVLAGRSTPVP